MRKYRSVYSNICTYIYRHLYRTGSVYVYMSKVNIGAFIELDWYMSTYKSIYRIGIFMITYKSIYKTGSVYEYL